MTVGTGNLNDDDPVSAAFHNLDIALRQNVHTDIGRIVDTIPEIRNQRFRRGERHTRKTRVGVLNNTQQNIAAESIGKG